MNVKLATHVLIDSNEDIDRDEVKVQHIDIATEVDAVNEYAAVEGAEVVAHDVECAAYSPPLCFTCLEIAMQPHILGDIPGGLP